MRTNPIADIRGIAAQFQLGGRFISAGRYGRGHINDTFVVSVEQRTGNARFILQRINQHVFRDPLALMENVSRITEHLSKKNAGDGVYLALIPAIDGGHCYRDQDGAYWRAHSFIEGARSYDEVASATQAREAAAMFGRFQSMVSDLPGRRLHETIPDFHNTPTRYAQFRRARTVDAHDRARHCMREIEWVLAHEQAAGSLRALQEAGQIPERITHNDTKLNNVMFDEQSGKALCVIDLDTVMPGLVLYDFGDLVRTATMTATEDEPDLSRVGARMDYFEALVEGYLSTAMAFLTDVEIKNLAVAGKVITIETGLRFLTDYLSGDEYFRIHRPDHNLDRCRAQLALAASIDGQLADMQSVVANVAARIRGED